MIVDLSALQQHIDGFGAADVFMDPFSDAQADLWFSPSLGIGLSLMRTGIQSDGTSMSAYSNATKAAARGALVWAAPWTAPAAWKDNNSEMGGGYLLPAHYDDWATRLAAFAGLLQSNAGVPLYALSVQNEPDYQAGYISMLYNPQAGGNGSMLDFVKILGPKLAALSPRPLLILPETSSWNYGWAFANAILTDPVAAPFLNLVGVHQYQGVSPPQGTLPIWQTEMSSFEPFDPSITNALMVARWIHDALTLGGVSAWHAWWLLGINSDDEGLMGYSHNTTPTKRLYAVGNFSKFIRPGFYLTGVSGVPPGLVASAYTKPSTGDFVIVVINTGGDTPLDLSLLGTFSPGTTITPWITSATLDLVAQSTVTLVSGACSVTVPTLSVMSLVGSAVGQGQFIYPPPALVAPARDTALRTGGHLRRAGVGT